jgi:O-antigen/teichoic acid export membrane protein
MPSHTAQLLAHARSVIRVARLTPFDDSTPEGRSLERYRRIVLSTTASLAGTAVTTLVGLAIVPLVINNLGKDMYGLWAAVFSLTPWVALLDLGMVAGMVVAIAEAHGRDDREAARSYFSTAFFALLSVAVLASLLVGGALAFAPWESILPMPAGLPRASIAAGVALVGVLACLSLPLALVPQVYAGYQKAYVATAYATAGSVLSLALLVAVVRLHGSPFAVFAAASGAGFATALASLAYLSRRMPWMRPAPGLVSRRALRRLLGTATPLYLFQLGSLLVNQSQRPLLASQAGLGVTAEYDLLMRIYVLSLTLITVSSASFAPTFRESLERGEPEWMRRTFWRLVRLRMLAAAAVCIVLVAGGNLALRVWLRRQDFQFDTGAWLTLSALILVAVWSSSFFELLTILDRIWPQVAVVLVQGPVTVALTWYLGGRYGIQGALLALTVPSFALAGWIVPLLAWRLVRSRTAPA